MVSGQHALSLDGNLYLADLSCVIPLQAGGSSSQERVLFDLTGDEDLAQVSHDRVRTQCDELCPDGPIPTTLHS